MQLATLTTRTKGKKRNLYWEVRFFSTIRNLRRWSARQKMHPDWQPPSNAMAVTYSWYRDDTDPDDDYDPDCVGTVALCDKHLDLDTLTHESVHMAKILQEKQHTLRDEEALAYAVASITTGLVRLATRRAKAQSAWKGVTHWNTFIDTEKRE